MKENRMTVIARLALLCAVVAVAALGSPGTAIAQDRGMISQLFETEESPDDGAWENFVEGWENATDWRHILPGVVNILLAVILMLPLLYGRARFGAANALAIAAENKANLIFATVSAAIAVLVLEHPTMALVVFGMGGLLRFRTPVESAQGTGRAIFAVVIGLACGLSLYAIAVLLTVMIFILITLFESIHPVELVVKDVPDGLVKDSIEEYRAATAELGGKVSGVREAKDGFAMVALVPPNVSPRIMRALIRDSVNAELQGRLKIKQEV